MKFLVNDMYGTFSSKALQENETTSHIEKVKIILTAIEEEQGINAGDLRNKCGNFAGYPHILDGLIKAGSVIVDPVKSRSGSATKCHYTSDYYDVFVKPSK